MFDDDAAIGRLFKRHRNAKTTLICLRSDLKAKGKTLEGLSRNLSSEQLGSIRIVDRNFQYSQGFVNAPIEVIPFGFLEELAEDVERIRMLEKEVSELETCLKEAGMD